GRGPVGGGAPGGDGAAVLPVVSLAARGRGADLRRVARAGGRVMATVALSLLALTGLGLGLIRMLHLA
ncbi:MAG: putative sulfate exporter family transporter, partial [Gluconacetobacter liquefaciens]